MAEARSLKIKYLTKQALLKFTNQRPAQNVVLKCEKLAYTEVRQINDLNSSEAPATNFVVFLDQVTDPQNFGSILRTAMFLGLVNHVVVNKRNACGLTPTVSKVSSGALEFMDIKQVKFVSKFFIDARQ